MNLGADTANVGAETANVGAETAGEVTGQPPATPADSYAPQLAHGATGLLAEFNRAGVLGPADVHTAQAIGRIGGESRGAVQLAVALAVRALRAGSVCIDLRTVAEAVFADTATDDAIQQLDVSQLAWPEPSGWVDACRASPLVSAEGEPEGRPLRMADDLLYLDRYWRQEETVRRQLQQRATVRPPQVDEQRLRAGLNRIFDSAGLAAGEPDLQQQAAAISVLSWVSVLAGGPGTGKTTTVAKLLALLHDQHVRLDERADPDGAATERPGSSADERPVSSAAGGPGTGPAEHSTTGPAADPMVWRPLRIALAAPTGKAAARLEEAVRSASERLPATDRSRMGSLTASTVHRLLGWTPDSRSRFRHNSTNHLPFDVVVVDEMSMVPLTLMARLLEAVRPDARLVLVGDPDQLSSVEAGAVLADIVNARGGIVTGLQASLDRLLTDPTNDADQTAPPNQTDPPNQDDHAGPTHHTDPIGQADPPARADGARAIVRLQHTWRFGGAISLLAEAIRASDPDRVMEVLRSGDENLIFAEPAAAAAPFPGSASALGSTSPPEVAFAPSALRLLQSEVTDAAQLVTAAAEQGDIAGALAGLEQHRLLCAHRHGPYGVTHWTRQVLGWLADAANGFAPTDEWYPGRPLLITANDYEMSLYNGDTGVVVRTPRGVRAAFARGGSPTLIAPARLDAVQSVHAMTVHRAQGSQFRTVSFVVPPPESPLLTRELLYTAVTRATERVIVIGSEEAIRRATRRPANRASGLRNRLWH